jgi:hypothetical protein
MVTNARPSSASGGGSPNARDAVAAKTRSGNFMPRIVRLPNETLMRAP